MAFIPAAGVVGESIIVAIVIEVNSVVTIGTGSITCKSITTRFVEVDSMRVFRSGIFTQRVVVAIVVEVNSRVVTGSRVGCQIVVAGIIEEYPFVVI
jgi:hypothetical protein